MPREENDRVSGQAVTGFFTTITRQRIHRTLCSNFWRIKIVQLCRPPYIPEIAPCNFWMFPKLKMALKGKRFDDNEMIQSNATRELKAIPKSAFEDCFKMWKQRGDMNAGRILFGHTSYILYSLDMQIKLIQSTSKCTPEICATVALNLQCSRHTVGDATGVPKFFQCGIMKLLERWQRVIKQNEKYIID